MCVGMCVKQSLVKAMIMCLWAHVESGKEQSNIIQIWHLGECNINLYCTLKNDIA